MSGVSVWMTDGVLTRFEDMHRHCTHLLFDATTGTDYDADLIDDDGVVHYTIVAREPADRSDSDGSVVERGHAPGSISEVANWLRRTWRPQLDHGSATPPATHRSR